MRLACAHIMFYFFNYQAIAASTEVTDNNGILGDESTTVKDEETTALDDFECLSCSLEKHGRACQHPLQAIPTAYGNDSAEAFYTTLPTVNCSRPDSCQVWRFFADKNTADSSSAVDNGSGGGAGADGDVYYLERGCGAVCSPGCVTFDDMEHRFISCYSCCRTPSCNVDNAARAHSSAISAMVTTALLATVFVW